MKKKPKEYIAEVIPEFAYTTAGRTWMIKNVTLKIGLDGTKVIPGSEISRMNRVVAKEICSSPYMPSLEELEFLCDITTTTYTELKKWFYNKFIEQKEKKLKELFQSEDFKKSIKNRILVRKGDKND